LRYVLIPERQQNISFPCLLDGHKRRLKEEVPQDEAFSRRCQVNVSRSHIQEGQGTLYLHPAPVRLPQDHH